jgi:uncharacterized protein YndB with AHSA1/START domain
MAEILHTLRIDGKRRAVYRAITEQDGLRGWWTRFTMAEPTVGYVNEFGFGGAFKFQMRIDDLEPDERVEWTCVGGHEEWEGTRLYFKLSDIVNSKGTLVEFEHGEWITKTGVLAQCSYDWAQYLRSLKLYIENGVGTPS